MASQFLKILYNDFNNTYTTKKTTPPAYYTFIDLINGVYVTLSILFLIYRTEVTQCVLQILLL